MENFRWESLRIIKHWENVTVSKIYSQIIKIRADVFLEEAAVEPAVLGFVAKSVVCVIWNHMIIVDLSVGKCMEILYSMTFKHSVKIGGSEQERGYNLLIYFYSFCPKGLWDHKTFTTMALNCPALIDHG